MGPSRDHQHLESMAQDHGVAPFFSSGQGQDTEHQIRVSSESRVPTFGVFASKPAEHPESYQRFLPMQLREAFDTVCVPSRLL